MIVKTSFAFILWVAMAGIGQGQTPKLPPKTKPAARVLQKTTATTDKTLLWEITGKNLTQPSYLFGTMHILCADDAQLSDNLKKAIKDCQVIYFEVDMDNMGEMMGVMKYLRMNDGKKLSDLLTPEEYKRVENYFTEHKMPMPLSMMNRFKPYFVTSIISERMMSCEKTDGMEQQIMRESKQYDKEIKGLETLEFQASLFDSIPYDKQAKDLLNYVDSIDSYKSNTLEMVEVYRQQDLKKMDALMLKSDPGMENYMDLLLYGRNRHWVEQMPGIMGGRSVLFAVGAGHLGGTKGVISLLRKSGYTVRPLGNQVANTHTDPNSLGTE